MSTAKSIPKNLLYELGPLAFLELVGEAGGPAGALMAHGGSEHLSTWNHVISEAKRKAPGRDWREFAPKTKAESSMAGSETSAGEVAEGPTIIVKPASSEEEAAAKFEPEDVDREISAGDAEEMASRPIPQQEVDRTEQVMTREEDDETQDSLPESAFQEDVPRDQSGRLRIPEAVKPSADAPPAAWFDYLTVISQFREVIPEVRLRVAEGKNWAGFIPVADIHAGKQGCRFAKLRALVAWGMEHPGYYFGGLGDWANCPTIHSPEADQLGEQVCTLNQSLAALYWLWKPIADAGRLLGIANGNHEKRIAKATGQDLSPMKYLAERLNVSYWGYETPLMMHVGECTYCTYLHHGTGGGQTLGYILATLERMAWNNDADAILMAHRHMTIAVERAQYRPEVADVGFEWQHKFRWLICCGCMCESVASEWSREKNLPPTVAGTVTLRYYANRQHMHARV